MTAHHARGADAEFANDPSGCTAVAALLVAGPPAEGADGAKQKVARRIIVANAGDSRSVLSVRGEAKPMSYDHKPGNKGESGVPVCARSCAHHPDAAQARTRALSPLAASSSLAVSTATWRSRAPLATLSSSRTTASRPRHRSSRPTRRSSRTTSTARRSSLCWRATASGTA